MVALIRCRKLRIFATLFPVEVAAVDDYTAEGRAVTAKEFRSRMYDDICTMLKRAEEVRRAEGVIDDYRQTVLMCDLGDGIYIWNVAVRIAESLEVDELGVVLDCILDFLQIMCINESRINTEFLQREFQEVVGAALDRLLCYDVVACLCEGGDSVRYGCSTRGNSKRSRAAFEGCDALFQYINRRVRQAAIDVARVLQPEAIRSML